MNQASAGWGWDRKLRWFQPSATSYGHPIAPVFRGLHRLPASIHHWNPSSAELLAILVYFQAAIRLTRSALEWRRKAHRVCSPMLPTVPLPPSPRSIYQHCEQHSTSSGPAAVSCLTCQLCHCFCGSAHASHTNGRCVASLLISSKNASRRSSGPAILSVAPMN
jgi:hypothetical protein